MEIVGSRGCVRVRHWLSKNDVHTCLLRNPKIFSLTSRFALTTRFIAKRLRGPHASQVFGEKTGDKSCIQDRTGTDLGVGS